MRKLLELGLLLLPLMLSAQTGNEILKKVEDTMNAPKDRVATMKLILIEKNGDSMVVTMITSSLGAVIFLPSVVLMTHARFIGLNKK